ncbi:hypothetical protein [Streptomyces sp. NPDC001930]|uniref:hypothetical protein n=1 Tax=Streptomyces sp. NPDC001930 TaxID=3364625 RepID=UPI0036CEFACB
MFAAWGPCWPLGDRRLCAAIVDRLAFGGNMIEIGTDRIGTRHCAVPACRC